MVIESINKFPELKIIDTQQLYNQKFKGLSEQAFYKAISRMAKSGAIERLTKGIYYKPKKGRFGNIASSDQHILECYLSENMNNGVIVGYHMYNKYGLTTQVAKVIEIYSNLIYQEKRQIKNVEITRANLRFDTSTSKMIELLYFLENYNRIEELNRKSAISFIENAVEYYNRKTIERLIRSIGYKKSTLASLKNILDYFNISHKVGEYLSGTSRYKAIRMEELYEAAS
jgi:hypothetical protein